MFTMKFLPKNPNKKLLLYIFIVMFAAATILPAMYFYYDAQKAKSELAKQEDGNAQLEEVIGKVEKLVLLPTGETPTLATVTDKELLSGQAFYTNAENGDKVLIYTSAKKAYLYRPSTNQIIEIAPVTVDSKESTTSAKP